MKNRRFTLVEVLVVMGIIAILAGMVVGTMTIANQKTCEARTKSTMKMIEIALETYKAKYGYYPNFQGSSAIGTPKFVMDVATSVDETKRSLWGVFHDVRVDSSGNPNNIKGMELSKETAGLFSGRYIILDGWGSPIIYVCPGVFNKSGYDLCSMGADGYLGSSTSLKVSANSNAASWSRTSGNYYDNIGKGDDISNFKRAD